jgi:hypothetical protein
MTDVRMFRTIGGEDVIAEYIETTEQGDVYINAIQLVIVPSRDRPGEQSYAFSPYPQYAQPKSDAKITFNPNFGIQFFITPDEQFLEQYNTIFGNIVAPSQKFFLGK